MDKAGFSILLAFYIVPFCIASEWGYSNAYGHLDPKHWYLKYEKCNGSRQSPIDIELDQIYADNTLTELQFSRSYLEDKISNMTLVNDGHTVRAIIPDPLKFELNSTSLPARYILKQFHFHWGHNDDIGSEHEIDHKYYPLELHFVHFNEDLAEDKISYTNNSIVVVAVLFKWTEREGQDRRYESKELDKIVNAINSTEDEGDNTTITEHVIVRQLLPKDLRSYLRYSGSLTTPPCSEVVEWIILTHTLNVSRFQMEKFRILRQEVPVQLKSSRKYIEAEIEIEMNDRPLAALNDRTIRRHGDFGDLINTNKPVHQHIKGDSSSAGAIHIQTIASVFLCMSTMLFCKIFYLF